MKPHSVREVLVAFVLLFPFLGAAKTIPDHEFKEAKAPTLKLYYGQLLRLEETLKKNNTTAKLGGMIGVYQGTMNSMRESFNSPQTAIPAFENPILGVQSLYTTEDYVGGNPAALLLMIEESKQILERALKRGSLTKSEAYALWVASTEIMDSTARLSQMANVLATQVPDQPGKAGLVLEFQLYADEINDDRLPLLSVIPDLVEELHPAYFQENKKEFQSLRSGVLGLIAADRPNVG